MPKNNYLVLILLFFYTTFTFFYTTFTFAYPNNLLINPGAENGLNPWYTFGERPTLQASISENHSGAFSFFITNRTQFYHDPAYDIKPLVTSGDTVAVRTPNSEPFNQAYLENSIDEDLLEFANNNNVPSNVGEYGIVWEAYGENVGATRWMTDVYDIFDGNNIRSSTVSRFYFSYQGSSFGLYTNWTGFQPNQAEVTSNLKAFFENKYTWTGNTDNSWSSSENWDVGVVPGNKHNVYVEPSSNMPQISGSSDSCKTLTLKSGATVTLLNGASLHVNE